ncbi:MAG: 8-amino-7-oxononanoate synthase [Nitrospirota bacterium]|nr:8-amino-7-oxononanoate synthase [Nitrospirota bacterium]
MNFQSRLEALRAAGRKRTLTPVDGPQGAEIVFGGRRVLNLASNNYLGLANHPTVVEAVRWGLEEWGFGAGAARLICGDARVFHQLEERLAALKGAEAALLFGSGYQCNLALLQALAPEGTVFCDRLNHASLIDGARLAGASLKVYRHADTQGLAGMMGRYGAPLTIATDGVFSMDGDLAPLPELAALARRHHALLLVDDAHGTGVLGGGRGSVHAAGLTAEDVPVQMGTLGKALGGYGAFVAGSRELVDYLIHAARGFVFTTALPPAAAAGALAALDIVASDEGAALRGRLRENRARLAAGLVALGWPVPAAPVPILPLVVGSAERAVALSRALLERGFLAPAVRPPTVPEGTSRLRLTVMSSHTPEQIDRVLAALEECRDAA